MSLRPASFSNWEFLPMRAGRKNANLARILPVDRSKMSVRSAEALEFVPNP
jgi:hypothetical protein